MYPSVWQKHLNIQAKNSVIIIGGGIAGLSLAYWLAQKKIKSTLIEKDRIGEGASGRNAGFLTGGSLSYFQTLVEKYGEQKALEKWFYTKGNIDLLKAELNLSKDSTSYLASGTMTLLKNKDNKYEKAFEILKRNNYPIKKISSPLKSFREAYLFEKEAFNDPMETLRLLKERSKDYCQVLEGVKVLSIEEDLIKTNMGTIEFSKLFVATNYALGELLNLDNLITPKRAQIAYLKTDSLLPDSNMMLPEERIYLRSYKEGILIGGLRLIDESNENTSEISLNEKIQYALEMFTKTHFKNVKLQQKWAGIMGFTHDELPLSSEHIKDKVYYLGGFSGHGNGHAFRMAKELTELAF